MTPQEHWDHLVELKQRILDLSQVEKFTFGCYLLISGYMKAPLWLRILRRLVAWRFNQNKRNSWTTIMSIAIESDPKIIDNLLENMTLHLLYGKDKTGFAPVGGYDSIELYNIVRFLNKLDETLNDNSTK